jgi:hypothetical protein
MILNEIIEDRTASHAQIHFHAMIDNAAAAEERELPRRWSI